MSAAEIGFGRYFTSHMFLMEWEQGRGWHSPRTVPYGALSLDPAAAVFHYGQQVFDGFKAFRTHDRRIVLFRADKHLQRMRDGAVRLSLPEIEIERVLDGITELVMMDRDWVPYSPGTSLYIRPALVATETFLGVRSAKKCLLFVIMSPAGSFYGKDTGFLRIWTERQDTRAAPGGVGSSKTGANYAASLRAAESAKKRGFAQVLWLDASEHRYLEEVGTMNLFLRIGDELITPPTGDTILAGVTRDSVLTLAGDWGIRASVRSVSLDEVLDAGRSGTLKEVFGSGTAAVIAPVAEIATLSETVKVPPPDASSWATRFKDEITGIQYGKRPDRHGWLKTVMQELA
jgi:branched-chain amino acid aminotransferase